MVDVIIDGISFRVVSTLSENLNVTEIIRHNLEVVGSTLPNKQEHRWFTKDGKYCLGFFREYPSGPEYWLINGDRIQSLEFIN